MKSINQFAVLISSIIFLSACGGGDALEAKKAELNELKGQMAELKTQIGEAEEEIKSLDPTFGRQSNEILVATKPVEEDGFYHQFEVRGTVESENNVMISAETMGRIEKIYVKEGQEVKSGQTVIQLDADVLRNNISEVETSLDLADAIFKRQASLWEKNIGTEIQYLQAKNSKDAQERRLLTLKSQLTQYSVKAPFAGTVDDIPSKVGEMAQPGVPLARLINQKDMYIRADVSEAYLGKVKTGDKVDVFFPVQNLSFVSTVRAVSKVINVENRTFNIEIALPSGSDFDFQPNQVTVLKLIDYQIDKVVLVPTKLIQSDDRGKFVYVLGSDGGKNVAKKARVEPGLSYNSKTEVLSGLEVGIKLIDNGYRDVTEGVEVKLVKSTL